MWHAQRAFDSSSDEESPRPRPPVRPAERVAINKAAALAASSAALAASSADGSSASQSRRQDASGGSEQVSPPRLLRHEAVKEASRTGGRPSGLPPRQHGEYRHARTLFAF